MMMLYGSIETIKDVAIVAHHDDVAWADVQVSSLNTLEVTEVLFKKGRL